MTHHLIHVRPARPEDAGLLSSLAIASKAFWDYPQEFMDRCRRELTVTQEEILCDESHYAVADRNGEILGFYALRKLSATEFELEALFVHPSAIGQGVGRELIEHAKREAASRNAEFILVQSDPNAEAFYTKMGAKVIGARESASISGRMLPLLRFDIRTP